MAILKIRDSNGNVQEILAIRGKDGDSLEFSWNGTQLGVKVKGQSSYKYVDLKGQKGDVGDSLEFRWEGTKLGIKTSSQDKYSYVELKGDDSDISLKYAQDNLSNALKGSKSGEAIAISDASPIEHEMTVKVSGVSDLGAVKVKKYGKNVFKATQSKEHRGITFELLEDGTYHVYGTNDGTSDSYLDHYLVLPAGKYIGSGCPQGGSSTTYHIEFYNQATNSGSKDYGNGAVFEATATQRFTVQMVVRSGQTVDLIFKPMIEVGTGDKVYAPYIEPIEYPVSADGRVEGVTSIYPNTTLITDTAGAVIDCTYNRDINKAFEELYNAIISTGGNV